MRFLFRTCGLSKNSLTDLVQLQRGGAETDEELSLQARAVRDNFSVPVKHLSLRKEEIRERRKAPSHGNIPKSRFSGTRRARHLFHLRQREGASSRIAPDRKVKPKQQSHPSWEYGVTFGLRVVEERTIRSSAN
jgi:hypothetical protein